MTLSLLDPIEILEARMDVLQDEYVDNYTCIQCKKTYDYEMICLIRVDTGAYTVKLV